MTASRSAYEQLCALYERLHHLGHLGAMAGWDQAVMMPKGGGDARSSAIAELELLMHRMVSDPSVERLLDEATEDSLGEWERANVNEMRRLRTLQCKLPERLVSEKVRLGARCEQAWRVQRPANDWKGFLDNWKPVVAAAREEAQVLSEHLGLSRYDALMEKFEPGVGSVKVQALFTDLMKELPAMIRLAQQKQQSWGEPTESNQAFDLVKQKMLCEQVMKWLRFDTNHGRLDVSTHPFCGGVPEDVRITTSFNLKDPFAALLGVVHETGHALYEQHLNPSYRVYPVGRARSMSVHESQSLLHEMQLGGNANVLAQWVTMAQGIFGKDVGKSFDLERVLQKALRVEPSKIRIYADELTYPAHIALRFEIEKALIEGEIEPEDVPELWNQKMMSYLGVNTQGDYKDGCLQDIHWTDGSFGYFPSYTLGAMMAAQWMWAAQQKEPDLKAQLARGELGGLHGFLNDAVWNKGCLYSTLELVKRGSGAEFSSDYFKTHLKSRYLS